MYGLNGGVGFRDIPKMSKKKFTWLLKRLADQKKKENEAMSKTTTTESAPKGRMKYLGK